MKKFLSLALPTVLLLIASGVRAADDSRVWVVFKPGQKGAVKAQIQNAQGRIHYEFDNLNAVATTLPTAALAAIRGNPNVVLVEEDPPRQLLSTDIAPYGIDMVQATGVWDTNNDGTIDADAPTGAGITVGVIDSGVYTNHEDFSGVSIDGYPKTITKTVRVKGKRTTETITLDPNDEQYWGRDYLGHGTHVTGTIAASINNLGVVGVSPGKVNVFMVKVFGDNGNWVYSSTLLNAVQKAVQVGGAKIISMSLGGGVPSTTESDGLNQLYSQGVLLIAAAGNDGNTAYSYPASYDSVISVAAVDSSGTVADFSQKNNQVELSAPGVGVLSTIPFATPKVTAAGVDYLAGQIEFSATVTASGILVDGGLALLSPTDGSWNGKVVLVERGDISFNEKLQNVQNGGGVAAVIYNNAPGGFSGTLGAGNSSTIPAVSITQEDGQYLQANELGNSTTVSSPAADTIGSGYAYYDGTSMATPHVSGVAALVWSSNMGLSNVQIRDALQQSAYDLGTTGKDNSYGYGLVQASAALTYLAGGGGGSGESTTPPPPPTGQLSVSVSTDSASYVKNQTAIITVTVTDGSNPVSGAAVQLEVVTAKGNRLTGSATSDSGGSAVFTYSVNSGRDGTGTYHVTATATASGYDSGTDSTDFVVK